MANVLSKDEVDSLLGGISEGKVKTEVDIPEREEVVKPYDFMGQEGSIHLRMPNLVIIDQRLVDFLRTSLSLITRSNVDVNISSTNAVKFGEFARSIPLPTSLNIFRMEPLRGFGLLVLEAPLIFTFVDTFFGGKPTGKVNLEGRSFTTIEIKIIDKIVKTILHDFEQAWSDIHKLKVVFTRSEMDPQFAAIVTPNDTVVVIRFVVDLADASGVMTFCIPYSTLEPIREKLRYRFHGEKLDLDETWRQYISTRINELTVDLICILGTTKITGRELLEMKVDDVIKLDQKMNDPLTVSIYGIPKFRGYPGTHSKNNALRISEKKKKE